MDCVDALVAGKDIFDKCVTAENLNVMIGLLMLIPTSILAVNSVFGLKLAREASAIKKAAIRKEKINNHSGFREYLIRIRNISLDILKEAPNLDKDQVDVVLNFDVLNPDSDRRMVLSYKVIGGAKPSAENAEKFQQICDAFSIVHRLTLANPAFDHYEIITKTAFETSGGYARLQKWTASEVFIDFINSTARSYNRKFKFYPEDVGGDFTLDQWAKEYLVNERDHA